MGNPSVYELCRQLEGQLKRLLTAQDLDELPVRGREAAISIRRLMADARLDVRDYEFAETRAEQMKYAKAGTQRLEEVRQRILLASEYNVFSAIDVAHQTATIEQIINQLSEE